MEEKTIILLLAGMLLLVSVFQAAQVGDLAGKIGVKAISVKSLAGAGGGAAAVAAAPAASAAAAPSGGLGAYASQVGGC